MPDTPDHAAPVIRQGAHTLERGAALVGEARHDLDAVARRLEGRLAGLQGRWVGAGGAAFVAWHQAWSTRQAQITRALDDLQAALVATGRDTAATDAVQQAGYQRLAGRL